MRIAVVAFLGLPCTGVLSPGTVADPTDSGGPAMPAAWSVCDSFDPVTVAAAAQVGDVLEVEVSYAGGCGDDHRFGICRESLGFLESKPVQTGALLWHDAAGDACEARISETLSFDLATLYDAYAEAYETPGQVVVNLDGIAVTVDVPAR